MIFTSGHRIHFILLTLVSGLGILGGEVWGQVTLPHYDEINYTVGQGLENQTNWTLLNSGDNLLIASGNLSYSGLSASTGNKVTFDGAGIDAAKLFTQQTSGTVYYSFLLNVTALGSLNTTGGYFTGLTEGIGTNFGATVWTRLNGSGYDIGINPRTTAANTAWVTGAQTVNSTLFVVISYQIVSGTTNDIVKIWINPTPGETEPAVSASVTNTGVDLVNLNRILIRQDLASTTPFIEMDELRIGTTWASVTPAGATISSLIVSPTKLTGFNYIYSIGPSAEQSFVVSGTDLTDNISITPPTDYEISTGTGGSFVATNPITLTPSSGSVSNTTIYVRLKAGLSPGNYNSEDVNITSTDASAKTVTCSGNVICAIILAAPNTAVTENFDVLANTGTSSTVPCGWSFLESGGNLLYSAGDGSSITGDTYSFGTGVATDRAFGSLLSGSVAPTIGAQVINNTGGIINTLAIQYMGEQWRLGKTDREDRLDFQYSLDATSLALGNWIDVDPLDFIAPITLGVGKLDGNDPLNRELVSASIFGLSIPVGAKFWIRWKDFNASGSDDGLAIDDFSITALPPCALSISSFAPASGPSGTQVIINGNNFANITNVQFNGIIAVFTINSPTQITALVPSGNTSGFITLTNSTPCSVLSSSGFFTISTDCSFASDLIISEYVEGSSFNKAIEIVNLTGVAKDLSDYKLVMYFNGKLSGAYTINFLPYNLLNNDVYVVTNDSASAALKSIANLVTLNTSFFSGNDAVVLMKVTNSAIVDVFGNIGCNPGTSWTSGGLSTYDHTLVRKNTIFAGITSDPSNSPCTFPTLSTEWDQYDVDDFTHLGSHDAYAGSPPAVSVLLPQTICEGSTASFSATASGGVLPYTFVWKVLDNTGLWVTVPNSAPYAVTGDATSSTLTISNTSSSFNNYQYYCEVINGGSNPCNQASNAAKLVVASQWKGTTANWEDIGNWSCGAVPTSSTNVIIPSIPSSGNIMPVIDKLISADCRDIEIQINASLTIQSDRLNSNGSLIVSGTYTGPGKVTYNRYLTPVPIDPLSHFRRWFIISSPVNTSSGGFDGSTIVHNGNVDYDLAPYYEPENEGWRHFTEGNLPVNLNIGQGYVARVKGTGMLKFTGPLNSKNVTVPVTNTASISNGEFDNGWNAIGNPFTSALKITGPDGFIIQNLSKLETNYNAVYLWYQTGSYTGSEQYYRVINNSGYYTGKEYGGPIIEDYVQAGQGFLINAGIQGSSTVIFNHGISGMQVHSTTTTLKKSKSSWPGITLLASNNGRTRSTIVAFNEKMTTGLDPSYDAGLLSASDFNLYTHLLTGGNLTDFTIQCLPDTMYDSLAVPIGIDLPQPGTIIFKVAGVILPEGIYPVIEDRLLQLNTPLKTETDSLMVSITEATWGTGRLYLHFGSTLINTNNNYMPDSPKFTALYADQKITIYGIPEQGSRAWLYDINGRKLSSEYRLTSANQNDISINGLSSGIYLLKIEGKTYNQTLKITILNR